MAFRYFASDNNAGVHPKIFEAIQAANQGHVVGYGHDIYTEKMAETFARHFGENSLVFPVLTGTGANVLSIASQLRPYEAVICSRLSHLNSDECGAPERFAGVKLITLPTSDGKITPDQIELALGGRGDEHRVQPRLISITQPTELGTLYRLDEMQAISQIARKYNLLLHLDGARIANAVVALNSSFYEMVVETGIDILSFGGTKNGLLQGEAVVFLNPALAEDFKYFRKQGMQLFSKMRFVSAQLQAYLAGDLWRQNAQHANQMAQILAQKISQFPEITLWQPVETNAVFVELPDFLIAPLQKEFYFYLWEANIARWMTAFDTQLEDIDLFCQAIQRLLKEHQ